MIFMFIYLFFMLKEITIPYIAFPLSHYIKFGGWSLFLNDTNLLYVIFVLLPD